MYLSQRRGTGWLLYILLQRESSAFREKGKYCTYSSTSFSLSPSVAALSLNNSTSLPNPTTLYHFIYLYLSVLLTPNLSRPAFFYLIFLPSTCIWYMSYTDMYACNTYSHTFICTYIHTYYISFTHSQSLDLCVSANLFIYLSPFLLVSLISYQSSLFPSLILSIPIFFSFCTPHQLYVPLQRRSWRMLDPPGLPWGL